MAPVALLLGTSLGMTMIRSGYLTPKHNCLGDMLILFFLRFGMTSRAGDDKKIKIFYGDSDYYAVFVRRTTAPYP